ncbi:membrane protein [Halarchaeum grantii]|uniref:Membrane protein n=1 Tax=Halarchaeum grantii TaxID=1193105 RepID=A0A830ESM5_9EURY|nr:AarF/ABC1/UbiB kinase family protein [Halarchaeum grantii]GGL25460.1 membrane protein [Halarchaeum grantii]
MASLRAYWRFAVVAWQFLPLVWSYARDRRRFLLVGGRRSVSSERRTRRAERLLSSLLTLGPTFIKLGQLLSTRPDVLPPEYVEELSELQDQVPPAEWEAAREVLEAEVGPVGEAFDEFDTEAISGASLGQVYTARLDGERVAVKVRRPGIEPLVNADLRVVSWALPLLLFFVDDARAFSLENLAEEFDKTLREEMDYSREATMLGEIRANFADDDGVAIPDVYDSRSGERVLTMEYVEGTKISDVESLDRLGVDRHAVAETLERAYLQMIIEDGVFHADPHPGNLAVREDGTIVFYDFGMSGRVDESVQDRIVDFYVAVANQDIEAILDTLVAMGTLSPEADRATMAEVMELAIADARGESVDQYRVQQIVSKVEDTIYEFPLRLPSNLALVLRVATVVEGVCLTLDPDFDFVTVATDYLGERGYYERGAREFITETGDRLSESARASLRLAPKLERALDRVDRDDFYVRAAVEDSGGYVDALARRLVTGLLFGAGVVSTGLLYAEAATRLAAVAAGGTLVVGLLCWRSFRRRRGPSSANAPATGRDRR